MHDDGPHVILPAPAPEGAAERLRAARGILAAFGFGDAHIQDEGGTLLIKVPEEALVRLQDDALRESLVGRLKALGYPFVAADITPDRPLPRGPGGAV